jgi:transposase
MRRGHSWVPLLSPQLLYTIPGVGPPLGLTLATEIGEVSRFSSPSKLVGYAGAVRVAAAAG